MKKVTHSFNFVHDDARPGWSFIDSIFLDAQHSRDALASIHLGLLSSMIPAFCNW